MTVLKGHKKLRILRKISSIKPCESSFPQGFKNCGCVKHIYFDSLQDNRASVGHVFWYTTKKAFPVHQHPGLCTWVNQITSPTAQFLVVAKREADPERTFEGAWSKEKKEERLREGETQEQERWILYVCVCICVGDNG